jgi:hypothetical protein
MDEGTTIPISEGNKSKKKKEKAPPALGIATIQYNLGWLLSGEPQCNIPPELRGYPHNYITIRASVGDRPTIWKHIEHNNTAAMVSCDFVAGELSNWLVDQDIMLDGEFDYKLTMKQCRDVVDAWLWQRDPSREDEIKQVGFLSDEETVVHRLWFDPIEGVDNLDVAAPTWAEIIGRIQNSPGFCARIGSIFDPDCDRKQALWISGPGDSGKSQIAMQLKILAGGSYVTMSEGDLSDKFFKAELVGKRVCIMNEVSPRFINSEEFKSITGDEMHRIRPCGQQGYSAKLTPLLFFVSNNPPETQSKSELTKRIIYCRIGALPSDTEKIGQTEYQKMLTAELPSFVGWCVDSYNRCSGSSLPNEEDEMEDCVMEKEAEQDSFFHVHFVCEPTAKIRSIRFEEILREFGGRDRHVYRAYIKRTYGQDKQKNSKRGDRSWYYLGFRERDACEKNYPLLDDV